MQSRPGLDFDPDDAFRAFYNALDRFTVKPIHKDGKGRKKDGKPFVLGQSLVDWLNGPWPDHPKITQAARLHKAVYHRSQNTFKLISADQLSAMENRCLIVFSILLTLERGNLVDRFHRKGIVDSRLPMTTRSELRNDIKAMGVSEEAAAELATAFYEKQWMFCPIQFFRGMRAEYKQDFILPICQKENINDKGGSATGIYLIEVQEEFVSGGLKIGAERYNDRKDKFGYRYQFALKTFHQGNSDLFTTEIEAFSALQDHDGMVKYLGHYTHDVHDSTSTEQSNTTSNILLEYGDLDLDEYFLELSPPVFPAEILSFWKDLKEVGDAIKGVHNVEYGKGEFKEEYYGWHADIKPDNILSVHGKFKLADPGFARFVKKTEGIPMEEIFGGTETYGAPECHPSRRRSSFTVHQTIDIWSLGCVFSIAATWVALGHQGVRQYAEIRKKAIKNMRSPSCSPSEAETSSGSKHLNDCFHDGRVVLPVVESWHKLLRMILRKTDTTTRLILDLVDESMLRGDPKDRFSARKICDALQNIISESEAAQAKLAELGEVVPEIIIEGLRQLDNSAQAKAPSKIHSEKVSPDSHSRNAKTQRLEVPLMKTAHRSEIFKLEPARAVTSLEGIEDTETPKTQIETQEEVERRLHRDSGVHGFSPTSSPPAAYGPSTARPYPMGSSHYDGKSQQKAPAPSIYSTKSPPSASQNIYEARQQSEQSKKGPLGIARQLFGKETKDEVLSKYFDDRDLIFLVDNGATMKNNWLQATLVLDTLVAKAAGQDDDGVDLQFALGSHQIKRGKKVKAFADAMIHKKAIPGAEVTDIRTPLGKIFDAYLQRIKSKSKKPKKLTIIVLTDGLWDGMREKSQVNDYIVTFLQQVKDLTVDVTPRRVSIEFIQFGKDPDATRRLKDLDTFLKMRDIEDVIDTEPCDGDVYKMLLGSFVENYDRDEETTPPGIDYGEPDQGSLFKELPHTPSPSQILPFRTPIRRETDTSQRTMNSNLHQPGQSHAYTATGSMGRHSSHRYSQNSG